MLGAEPRKQTPAEKGGRPPGGAAGPSAVGVALPGALPCCLEPCATSRLAVGAENQIQMCSGSDRETVGDASCG